MKGTWSIQLTENKSHVTQKMKMKTIFQKQASKKNHREKGWNKEKEKEEGTKIGKREIFQTEEDPDLSQADQRPYKGKFMDSQDTCQEGLTLLEESL